MTAILIPNSTTFGQLTNTAVGRLAGINTTLLRLNEAVSTASAGFTGTPGTEFEATAGQTMGPMATNNFGIQPDSANLGTNGQAYADALTGLVAQWVTFWTAAAPFIKQLDNGTPATSGTV